MPELAPLQNDLVEEFGNIYEAYGLQRLKGLIIGLLICQPDPVSLGEISELLNRSKGPLSGAVRDLAGIGLIRKVNGPENRRDYYQVHPDVFFNNFKFNMATVRKNRRTAEQFYSEFASKDSEENAATLARLDSMRAFYTLMESFYASFADEWMQSTTKRPT